MRTIAQRRCKIALSKILNTLYYSNIIIALEASHQSTRRGIYFVSSWRNFFDEVQKTFMNKGPVYVVDEDIDDQLFLTEAWDEIPLANALRFFKSAEDFLVKMETDPTVPFLIICEIKLPKISGLELKRYLLKHANTHYKSIPFVFLAAHPSPKEIKEAYDLCTHGVFKKHNTLPKIKAQLIHIANYWAECLVPINA